MKAYITMQGKLFVLRAEGRWVQASCAYRHRDCSYSCPFMIIGESFVSLFCSGAEHIMLLEARGDDNSVDEKMPTLFQAGDPSVRIS